MPCAVLERISLESAVRTALVRSPAVALVGPRQVGKTTLARRLLGSGTPDWFDLKDPQVEAQLASPMVALKDLRGLVAIDDVQHGPNLFKVLHVLIDRPGSLARSMGVNESTVRRYLDWMTQAYLVRHLQPWFANLGKRQVKAPKIHLRDTGLLHELLGIADSDALARYPKGGASWAGFALGQVYALRSLIKPTSGPRMPVLNLTC